MTKKLEPLACPFCKIIPPTKRWCFVDGQMKPWPKWTALICVCGAHGPDVRTMSKSWPAWRNKAVKAWNDRATVFPKWQPGAPFPCPFCGNLPNWHTIRRAITPPKYCNYFLSCDGDMCLNPSTQDYSMKADAIKAWNERAQ